MTETYTELDAEALAELQDLMGEDLADLATAYAEDGQTHIDTIMQALTSGDAEAASEAAHSLKSSSANMSALGVSELARQVEMLAKAGNLAEIKPIMASLPERFTQAVTELQTATS